MSAIISEIVKIAINPAVFMLASPAFARLRKTSVEFGVKEQYYGINTEDKSQLFWIIHWPKSVGIDKSDAFRKSVKELDVNGAPESWYIPFDDASAVRPGLTAPVFDLCFLHESGKTDKSTIADSLHKTFTDCYEAEGFTGGSWGTATNDSRMNYYYLGWESRAFHANYSATPLFAVEIDNLMPHMDGGKGYFMKMEQQLD
ncbi:hypothetical protein CVT25_014191 [Psilocybe cyanescens]|uniref:Uncharacterized protein n=1 Tax=Psilocybe cyanescens TaxID=93625 RepID=A0A409XID4_PSICY|nr:hypothetical protein CVT25_014191 [Psilocybe cyanescens]